MRIQNSAKTNTTNQQETQNTNQPVRTSQIQNGVASVKDSLEIFSASNASGYEAPAEASRRQQDRAPGGIELSTEQQQRLGSLDLENARQKPSERQTQTHTRKETSGAPPHQTAPKTDNPLVSVPANYDVRDRYTITGQQGPAQSPQDAMRDRNARKDQFRSQGNSVRAQLEESLNNPFGDYHDMKNQARKGISVRDDGQSNGAGSSGSWDNKWADRAKKALEYVLDVLGEKTNVSPPGGNEVTTILKAPETINEMTEEKDGYKHIITTAKTFADMRDGVYGVRIMQEVGPLQCPDWDKDGTGGKSPVNRQPLGPLGLEDYMREMKGQKTGGETVNPGADGTAPGNGSSGIGGRQLPGYDKDMIAQPSEDPENPGNTGGGGGTNPVVHGGSIDYEDRSGWTGGTRTEEPSDVDMTSSAGSLEHIIEDDDEEEDK